MDINVSKNATINVCPNLSYIYIHITCTLEWRKGYKSLREAHSLSMYNNTTVQNTGNQSVNDDWLLCSSIESSSYRKSLGISASLWAHNM